jgi:hypothetical protein
VVQRCSVGDRVAIIGIIFPITEAVNAQLSGVAAAHHRSPGRNGDGRMGAFEASIYATRHQATQRRQLLPPLFKHQLWGGAVQAYDQKFHCHVTPHYESLIGACRNVMPPGRQQPATVPQGKPHRNRCGPLIVKSLGACYIRHGASKVIGSVHSSIHNGGFRRMAPKTAYRTRSKGYESAA